MSAGADPGMGEETYFMSTDWRRSTRCANSGCVEARLDGDEITVRNSNHPQGPSVSYDRDEWRAFVAGVKAGEFDLD